MIVYGYTSAHLATTALAGTSCPGCGTPGALRLSVFGRYAHVYWLPLLPLGKSGAAQCAHCQLVLRPKELPKPLRAELRELRARTRTPLRHCLALLLLGTAALGSFGAGAWHQVQDQERLAHPHIGDIYHIRSEAPGYYTLLKVTAVNGNSVRLKQNNYETDREAEIEQLDTPENYDAEPFDLTQLDLQIMKQQQQLVAVERPEGK
ncbi:hypothetical protein LJ737_26340 [Hymenobacter sp. 15J16-1T3B]|uniref:hypothetical protein n=1 Tax=Hymenobacter sp. 15J16-1T3B TaxID=2886941 RepID=UPI001D0FA5A5|nr:hypothetical protein [Hymenobacter sp. 15J16-1T3B]MCC3160784.1 hypothetical protein [Hymenobacter sp. 15J16-1T3B]